MLSETAKDLWNGKTRIFCLFHWNGTRNDWSFLMPITLADTAVPVERFCKERRLSKSRSVPFPFLIGRLERNERFYPLQTNRRGQAEEAIVVGGHAEPPVGAADLAGAVHLVENGLELIWLCLCRLDYFLRLPISPIVPEPGAVGGDLAGFCSNLRNFFRKLSISPLPLPVPDLALDRPPDVDPFLWREC